MTSEKAYLLAGEVLDLAARLDIRIREAAAASYEAMVSAWGLCFDGQKVWSAEARDAVVFHYSKPNSFPLTPGDVIAFCSRCPVYSSVDHANHFLAFWAEQPYADTIETYSGIRPPDFPLPESMSFADERKYLTTQLRAWVEDNREKLVDAIMERRYRGVEE
ncbi:hypothetical protein [Nocardia wallacei]|uniref:hypothetical protein n=1 Tax=Nocardia wallacei TaxID=480035 RepID=UPI002458B790|nr:hypothetical protein [Nocardia wallacei]